MISPDVAASVRAQRRRRLAHLLVVTGATAELDDQAPAAAMPLRSSSPPFALAETMHDLYESMLATRSRARQRLLTIQDIEQWHRDLPLAELAELAVNGALHQPGADGGYIWL